MRGVVCRFVRFTFCLDSSIVSEELIDFTSSLFASSFVGSYFPSVIIAIVIVPLKYVVSAIIIVALTFATTTSTFATLATFAVILTLRAFLGFVVTIVFETSTIRLFVVTIGLTSVTIFNATAKNSCSYVAVTTSLSVTTKGSCSNAATSLTVVTI